MVKKLPVSKSCEPFSADIPANHNFLLQWVISHQDTSARMISSRSHLSEEKTIRPPPEMACCCDSDELRYESNQSRTQCSYGSKPTTLAVHIPQRWFWPKALWNPSKAKPSMFGGKTADTKRSIHLSSHASWQLVKHAAFCGKSHPTNGPRWNVAVGSSNEVQLHKTVSPVPFHQNSLVICRQTPKGG